MRVRACRRRPEAPGVAGVDMAGSVAELAASCDHLVLAAPATPATRHLVGAAVLARARPGLHLVNVARGALVDHDALRAALEDGRVAMASLDAVEPEPLPDGHWLYAHPRVRLSPHVSWSAPGAADALVDRFIENVRRWRTGAPLAGVVDADAGY
jgi:phosphoglycerate dehydrogenase-like enzyme